MVCILRWQGITRRSPREDPAPASFLGDKIRVESYLLEAYGLIFGADLPRGAVGRPTGGNEKSAEGVICCIHPAISPDEAVSTQSVGAGIQQPRSMALVLGRGIDHELINRTLRTPVGIRILVRHRRREPDDSLAVGRDKNSERGLRWSLDGQPPGVDHVSQ